jgi:hypothetical protein
MEVMERVEIMGMIRMATEAMAAMATMEAKMAATTVAKTLHLLLILLLPLLHPLLHLLLHLLQLLSAVAHSGLIHLMAGDREAHSPLILVEEVHLLEEAHLLAEAQFPAEITRRWHCVHCAS